MEHYDTRNLHQHFFASNGRAWATAEDPVTAVAKAKNIGGFPEYEGVHHVLYHVPVHPEAGYSIEMFTPQVDGVTKIYEGKC